MRLPELGLGELRQQWRVLYKAEALAYLSRELLLRAVAYRMQEVALGGLRPERQRQLRQFAQQFNASQEVRIRPRPELKPGTRVVREWQGRTYDVLVLDDGFSWQGTRTVCRCQPITLATSSTVTPSGRCSIAITASCFDERFVSDGVFWSGSGKASIADHS